MAVINRVPRGLLPLLDAKTQGRTPTDTADFVQPTLELGENYAADIPFEVEQGGVFAQPALGSFVVPISVPEGEQWLVYVHSSRLVYGSTSQTLRCGVGFSPTPNATNALVTATDQSTPFTPALSQVQSAQWKPDRPIIFRSGATFWVTVTGGSYSATSANVTHQILLKRLQL